MGSNSSQFPLQIKNQEEVAIIEFRLPPGEGITLRHVTSGRELKVSLPEEFSYDTEPGFSNAQAAMSAYMEVLVDYVFFLYESLEEIKALASSIE